MKFNHIGTAVEYPGKSVSDLRNLGYEGGEPVYDPRQQVNLILMTHDDLPNIELIFPHNWDPSPVDSLLAQSHWVMYHLCYEVQSIEETLSQLDYYTLIKGPTPAVLFEGRMVAFIKLGSGLVIELLEERELEEEQASVMVKRPDIKERPEGVKKLMFSVANNHPFPHLYGDDARHIKDYIRHLEDENAELRKDRERLEKLGSWLGECFANTIKPPRYEGELWRLGRASYIFKTYSEGDTLAEAIDNLGE